MRAVKAGGILLVVFLCSSAALLVLTADNPGDLSSPRAVNTDPAGPISASSTPLTYLVTFTEVGLPVGTNWSVSLNETTQSSLTSTITFAEPNGSYPLYPWDVKGYASYANVTAVHIRGAPVQVTVRYFPPSDPSLYYVTFDQSGLPLQEYWTVQFCSIVDGTSECGFLQNSFGPTHDPTGVSGVTNGTYEWKAYPSNVTEFPASLSYPFPSLGQLVVDGASLVVQLTFRYAYPSSFVEDGLPLGTSWSLRILNETFTEGGGTNVYVNVEIPNGTYGWSAVASGYRPQNGTITVQGGHESGSEELRFEVLPRPLPFSVWAWSALGATAAGGVVGLAFWLRRSRRNRPPLPSSPPRRPEGGGR